MCIDKLIVFYEMLLDDEFVVEEVCPEVFLYPLHFQ